MKNRLYITFILVLALFIPCVSLFFEGIYIGQDLVFHLNRIEAIYRELLAGHFPVMIGSYWLQGYGYPVSIYYPDIFLYLPALLRFLGIGMIGVYKVYVFISSAFLVGISYYSFSGIFKDRLIGALCTFAYSTASYRLTDLLVRNSLGEFSALVFFPLICYGVYLIYEEKEKKESFFVLAIGMTGVLLCHILSFEMAAIALAIFCVFTIRKTLNAAVLKRYFVNAFVTVALSAFFWVPLLDYLMHVNTRVSLTSNPHMLRPGIGISDVFNFFVQSNGTLEVYNLTPGPVLTIMFIVSIFVFLRVKKDEKLRRQHLVMIVLSLVFFIFSSYFPWDYLSDKVEFAKFFTAIQFPWRWVIFLCLTLTFCMGYAIKVWGLKKSGMAILSWIVLVAGTVNALYFTADHRASYDYKNVIYSDEKRVKLTVAGGDPSEIEETSFCVFVSVGEYLLEGTDAVYTYKDDDFDVITQRRGTDIVAKKRDLQRDYIEVPVFNYKGYRAYDENGERLDITEGHNNTLRVLTGDYSGEVKIGFYAPKLWKIARIISIFSVIAFVFLYIVYRDKKVVK